MSEIDPEVRKKIDETHDTVIELKTVLLGANGDEGLVGDVHKVIEGIEENTKKINKLRVIVYVLIGILSGLGVLDGAVFHKVIGG